MEEKILVSKIKEGIVVDHIDTGRGKDVVEILGLNGSSETKFILGVNYDSNKSGRKDFLKIQDRGISKGELNKISLVSPNATISIISNYEVVSKSKVEMPEIIEGMVRCFNPNCVTRHEKIKTKFYVYGRDPLVLKCHYCEKSSSKVDLM